MKYSRQRSIVLEVVKQNYNHPTAEQVYEEAKKVCPGIGIATVYRNLNQLAEMGEINKIYMGDGNDRFDGRLEEHYHMRCRNCGELRDLMPSAEKLEELRKMAVETFGLKASSKATFNPVVMEGVCDHCRKKVM